MVATLAEVRQNPNYSLKLSNVRLAVKHWRPSPVGQGIGAGVRYVLLSYARAAARPIGHRGA